MHECQPCYSVSSLLLLVGNRDDSNRDDKKYANSHLLCFLEAKLENVCTIILMPMILFSAWTILIATIYFFLKDW